MGGGTCYKWGGKHPTNRPQKIGDKPNGHKGLQSWQKNLHAIHAIHRDTAASRWSPPTPKKESESRRYTGGKQEHITSVDSEKWKHRKIFEEVGIMSFPKQLRS